MTIREEISKFNLLVKENNFEIEEFWKKNISIMPKLASLVKKYLIIPGSSVASESAFSIANFIQRKERSSLSSKNLRYSILLRENEKIKTINL